MLQSFYTWLSVCAASKRRLFQKSVIIFTANIYASKLDRLVVNVLIGKEDISKECQNIHC